MKGIELDLIDRPLGIFVAVHRTQLRPALWGIGYTLGFVMATMAGQMYFDDSFFLGMVYTLIGSAFVAVFGGLVPLEQWIAKKYPAAA